jgi:serine/threonine-protein kinase
MGELIVAEHLELGRQFVVKLLHQRLAGDPQLIDRVRVEAQSLGRLNHPNVVSVVGFGHAADGRPYIAMEYLRGRTLTEELASRRLSVMESVSFARSILSALGAAHALGIVHRDVKPDNLMLVQRTDGLVVKVLDFGMARVLPGVAPGAPQPLSFPTDTGVVVGTPRFVSPEAARGEEVDARADLYSAGLVLYVMLAGRGPFDHLKGTDRLLSAQAESEPELPSRYAVEPIPAELDAAVQKALAKRPEERFQSAAEFERELARVFELLLSRSSAESAALGAPERPVTPAVSPTETGISEPSSPVARAPSAPKGGSKALVAVFVVVASVTAALVAGLVTALLRFR